ncbi:MAG: Hsp20/alpha crystallin family protein [Alphaproteobacteria bacterium]
MVEASHTAGDNYPSILGPLRGIQQHIAEFFTPQADASASDEKYRIDIECPGVKLDDIDIEVHDKTLTVRGEKKSASEEKGEKFFFSERTYGSFQRSFRLAEDADTSGIEADFKDGLLSISIPKSGPAPEKTRKVEIKSG